MTGWRVWLAFEVRPGVSRERGRSPEFWRALAVSCRSDDDPLTAALRGSSGGIDAAEFERWMSLIVEHGHLWASA